MIKKKFFLTVLLLMLLLASNSLMAQQRRPIDSQHPMWLIHIDVWNQADPQKIINLIPEDIRPYVVMNLSLSCSFKTENDMYERPRYAVRTYKSWASVCQLNNMWFTCQPASGGHTHIQDYDLETFEYFFKTYPNFLGWNYAEQFWGFDEAGDKSSSTQASRIALFAKLVEMSHKYGGFLTVSFCGNIWSHPLNPLGMMKRNSDLLRACSNYPEAILWLYKYTTSSCFYNNESVTWGPFVSGLAKNYGVRYDNCGWNGALDALLGSNHGKKYPGSAGIGTVMEQTCVNGGAVWDGPELIWTEDFQNLSNSTVDGYTRRNWGTFANFKGIWLDMWRKIIDGTMYIPTRDEVVEKTKIVVINDVNSGGDEEKYAVWGDLYNGIYKQTDPFNRGNGQWMDNFCYFKSTGRYGAIPMVIDLYDDAAKQIPLQVKKSSYTSRWGTQTRKQNDFNAQYPEVSKGDLYVNRYQNQLVTYTPYTYLNKKRTASADIPLQYNTCDSLKLTWGKLSSGLIREYEDHIDFYLNNYRSDSTSRQTDKIVVTGVTSEPTVELRNHATGASGQSASSTKVYDAEAQMFTLNVSHMGPVDVTINCSGARIGQTPTLPNSQLPTPKQPDDIICPILIEAEDMDYKSVAEVKLTPYGGYAPEVKDFAGLGFVRTGSSTAGSLRHQLKLKTAGSYTIKMRYCNTSKAGTMQAAINGIAKTLTIEKCNLNDWHMTSFDATLKAGTNDLRLNNTSGISMHIDQIIYEPEGTPVEKFKVKISDTEGGVVTADVDSAAAGQMVTLTLLPYEGYSVKELRVINSIYYTQGWKIPFTAGAGTATFIMPDDNVTIQPVYNDDTSAYILDYTDVQNGTLPIGWRTTDGSDVRNYPASNGSGPRTFVGLVGYQGKALYWRTTSAEYGRLSNYPLNLEPGNYELIFAMAAWKGTPTYQTRILNSSGSAIKTSETFTAKPNINGNFNGDISAAERITLPFEIKTSGKYIIQFKEVGSGMQEFLLAECRIRNLTQTGIVTVNRNTQAEGLYNLHGRRVGSEARGVLILRQADGTARKIFR